MRAFDLGAACGHHGAMIDTALSRRSVLAGLCAGAALPATVLPARAAAPGSAAALLDDLAWEMLDRFPTGATALGVDTGAHAALRGKLEDRSPAGIAATRQWVDDALARLGKAVDDGRDPVTTTSLAVAQSALRTAQAGFALPYGDVAIGGWRNTPYVVIQNVGGYLDIPQMLDGDQPLRDAADADAYLSRLAATPALLDGELARLRDARGKGLVPPDFLIDRTIAAMTTCLAGAAQADGPFVGPLARSKLSERATAQAIGIARDGIVPALQRQLAEMQLARAVARPDAGMLTRPDGPQWYRWALRASTTVTRDPADLHAMGLAQLADLHAQMDPLLRHFGLTQGSVGERAIALQRRPELGFANDDSGRAAIVAYMQGRIDAIRPRLGKAFTRLTRGNLEIRRMPAAQEPGAPAAYGGPGSIDGRIPGKIWVNLGDPSIHNRVTIPDLVFHEGIPGHVWQGEYAQGLPLLRSILAFNAYSEGWALYAEQLADELGLYDDDPAGRIGYLMGLSWRAVRLVVDTGIHAMGWSRQRALDEFVAATGLPASNAASEINRYCAWPGQACGYKVGQTTINELRNRAKAALGAAYDLRDFNQVVVDGGNVPLDVLAGNVDRYIARRRG